MKVLENTGKRVTVEMEADEAAALAGREGFTDAIALQDQLQEALASSWHDAGRPPTGER